MKKTRTALALDYLDAGHPPGKAARLAEVSESALHRAKRKRDAIAEGRCPVCGSAHVLAKSTDNG